jgi:hypothetical protein
MWRAYALAMTGSATNLHSYSCFISCLRLVAVLLSSLVTFITLISGYPSYSSFAVVDTNDGSLQIYSGFLSTLFSAPKHVPVKKCCVNVEQVLRPDLQPYAPHYQSVNLNYPLFQVMASGLTTSTGTNFSCEAAGDPVGLRDHPECNFVRGPSFGMVEVEWEDADPIVRLQIRDGNTGAVRLESNFTLSTCGAVSGGYKES